MKKITLLTQRIRQWNSIGLSLLPTLELAIIHKNAFNQQVVQLLTTLGQMQMLYQESLKSKQKQPNLQKENLKNSYQNQIIQNELLESQSIKQLLELIQTTENLQGIRSWDPKLSNSIYAIYSVHEVIEVKVHLIIDQQINGKIDDESLKITKKIIEKLKRNKNIIFVNFNSSIHRLDLMSDHIEQFGLSFKANQRELKVQQLKSIDFNKNHKIQNNQKLTAKMNSVKKPELKVNDAIQNNENQNIISQFDSQKIPQISLCRQDFSVRIKSQLNDMFKLKSLNFSEILLEKIEKIYVNVFGVDLNKSFNEMKLYQKQIAYQLARYHPILKFLVNNNPESISSLIFGSNCQKLRVNIFPKPLPKENQQTTANLQNQMISYGLNCLHQAKQYLQASILGTFCHIQLYPSLKNSRILGFKSSKISQKRSLHWEILEIINEIWEIEGDVLLKQLQKMPLSYIKQRYEILDYQTLSGFMPASCFSSIFAGPLKYLAQHILETLEIIQIKIITQIKSVLCNFFAMTTVRDSLADSCCEQITKICLKFREETARLLKSQIEYVSVAHEDFWSFKQVNPNLYASEQQVYISIKYIGKNYVKKVFDTIKETMPRLIGQNLLREVAVWLETKSVELFTSIALQKRFQISISQRDFDFINKISLQQKIIDKLISYFSLKTNSQNKIQNLYQNIEKNWRRTFKNTKLNFQNQSSPRQKSKHDFLKWARNLIRKQKKPKQKKSTSSQKRGLIISSKQNSEVYHSKPQFLSQKNWLLILNIDKPVDRQKVQKSSEQGFPERLRPSIWLYLAKLQINSKSFLKVQSLFDSYNTLNNQEKKELDDVYRQIDKDVDRTPPPDLFRKGYLKQTITRVLRAYSIYDKKIRYTQGMNFIVGIILCVLTHYGDNCEYSAQIAKNKVYFETLQNQCLLIFTFIMEKKGLRKIMFIERATITDLCVRLENYIKAKSPAMLSKIQQSGFTVEMIFSPAIISGLTSSDIQTKLQKRVLDLLLTSQFDLIHKIIGQFVAGGEMLCRNLSSENLYYFLKSNLYNEVYRHIGDEGLTRMFHAL